MTFISSTKNPNIPGSFIANLAQGTSISSSTCFREHPVISLHSLLLGIRRLSEALEGNSNHEAGWSGGWSGANSLILHPSEEQEVCLSQGTAGK